MDSWFNGISADNIWQVKVYGTARRLRAVPLNIDLKAAAKGLDKDEKDKEGNYIRRERYAGTLSRSFYVGDAVSEEDIHAKYEDGILKLSVPKKAPKAVEKNGYIAIEG